MKLQPAQQVARNEFDVALAVYDAARREQRACVGEIVKARQRVQLLKALLAVDGRAVDLPDELRDVARTLRVCFPARKRVRSRR